MAEDSREPMGRHAGVYVRKKTQYFLDDHPADGIVGATVKYCRVTTRLWLCRIPRGSTCRPILHPGTGSGSTWM
jgi:hypothetical protein